MTWYWLADPPADAGRNMARDLALLDLAAERGVASVRMYTWAPHTLSFGANEPALKRYDRALIERRGLAVVRRPTGGRAVWHAEELTYSVTAPEGTLGTLAESYRVIHELIATALGTLAQITRGTPPDVAAAALNDVLGREVTPTEVVGAVRASFTRQVGELQAPNSQLLAALEVRTAMHRPRFLDDAWTWRR